MWSMFVSISNTILNQAMLRFMETFQHHPLIGAGFLAGFLVLAILYWVAVVQENLAAQAPRDAFENARPIRLRR
jgi:hypothetical protein